jgi:hypothetical protein
MTVDRLIAYHTGQARYSATVRTPAQLRARILRRARQQRLTASWGFPTYTWHRRSAS